MANIEEKVQSLIIQPITYLGYELYDVQYAKEGSDYFLRIFIENAQNSISLDDCEIVSRKINDILDEADYIKEQYFLEVSSAGVEKLIRKDKHLQQSINKEIYVKLFKPVNESKEYVGILKKYDENNIQIKTQEYEELNIERKNISLIKRYFDWNNVGGND